MRAEVRSFPRLIRRHHWRDCLEYIRQRAESLPNCPQAASSDATACSPQTHQQATGLQAGASTSEREALPSACRMLHCSTPTPTGAQVVRASVVRQTLHASNREASTCAIVTIRTREVPQLASTAGRARGVARLAVHGTRLQPAAGAGAAFTAGFCLLRRVQCTARPRRKRTSHWQPALNR